MGSQPYPSGPPPMQPIPATPSPARPPMSKTWPISLGVAALIILGVGAGLFTAGVEGYHGNSLTSDIGLINAGLAFFGLGALLFVIFWVVLGVYLWQRSRYRKQMKAISMAVYDIHNPATMPHTYTSPLRPVYQTAELGVQNPATMFELSGSSRVMAELGSQNISEMGYSASNQVSTEYQGAVMKPLK